MIDVYKVSNGEVDDAIVLALSGGHGGWEKILTDAMIAAEYHGKQLAANIGELAKDTWNHWRIAEACRQYADYHGNRAMWRARLHDEAARFMCLGSKDETFIMSHIVWAMNGFAGDTTISKRNGDGEGVELCIRRWRALMRHFQLCSIVDEERGLAVKGGDAYPRVFSAHARSIVPGPGETSPANQITYAGEALAWFSKKMTKLPASLRRSMALKRDPPRDYLWLQLCVELEARTGGWFRVAVMNELSDRDLQPTKTQFHRATGRGWMQTWFDNGPADCLGMLRPAFSCVVEYDPVTLKLKAERYGTDGRWSKVQHAENCTGPFRIIPTLPHDATDNHEYKKAT